jgi:type VI secretion system protein ImpB
MPESQQKKLDRVRAPKVQIVYEVETNGAEVIRELPFVVGVLGDFSGDPTEPLRPLRDRKFTAIDRDNLDDVMAKSNVGLNLRVDNKIENDGTEMPVQLQFKSMEDFEPGRVAAQIKPLEKMLEERGRLQSLLTKMELAKNQDEAEGILQQVIQEAQKQLKRE